VIQDATHKQNKKEIDNWKGETCKNPRGEDDVLFLNSKKRIVDRVLALRPFALNYVPKRAAKYVVELPEGLGKKAGIGDLLQW